MIKDGVRLMPMEKFALYAFGLVACAVGAYLDNAALAIFGLTWNYSMGLK